MPAYVKVSGTWEPVTPDVNTGTWGNLDALYAKASGVWELIWPGVSLSGEGVTSLVFSGTATAGIRVNTDGTIDKNDDGIYTQVDSGTDWIVPNSDADSTYEVRVTSVTGDSFDTSPGADGTWFALSSNREWNIQAGPAVEGKSTSFTLELRKGSSGSALVSGSYTLSAERA